MKTQTIDIHTLGFLDDYCPNLEAADCGVDLIVNLVRDLEANIPFRPIVVLEVDQPPRRHLRVGWNRVRAHKELGRTQIEADVFHGTTYEDANRRMLEFYEAQEISDGEDARAEPGYDRAGHLRHCSGCGNRASDGRCLAWEKVGAPEGWKPEDTAPRRCREFLPVGSCLVMGAPPRYRRLRITTRSGKTFDTYLPNGLTLAEIEAKYREEATVEIRLARQDIPGLVCRSAHQ